MRPRPTVPPSISSTAAGYGEGGERLRAIELQQGDHVPAERLVALDDVAQAQDRVARAARRRRAERRPPGGGNPRRPRPGCSPRGADVHLRAVGPGQRPAAGGAEGVTGLGAVGRPATGAGHLDRDDLERHVGEVLRAQDDLRVEPGRVRRYVDRVESP